MSEWINITERYPENGQTVLAKFWHAETDRFYELEAYFKDTEDYRSWRISKMQDGIQIICLPDEWKPID